LKSCLTKTSKLFRVIYFRPKFRFNHYVSFQIRINSQIPTGTKGQWWHRIVEASKGKRNGDERGAVNIAILSPSTDVALQILYLILRIATKRVSANHDDAP
jgi:hypothetical protein